MKAIEAVLNHAKRIAEGHERVKPGMAWTMTRALSSGEGPAQGDVGMEVIEDGDAVFAAYVRVESPTDADRQLVPGNTVGARHCLRSLDGVEMWRPVVWTEEGLLGPICRFSQPNVVDHPTHGAIEIPAGVTILFRYPRDWDVVQRAERRARD